MKKLFSRSEVLGEMLGTFILTLFGCGSVAVSVLFNAHSGLFQIALIWGIAVAMAIYLTRHLSCAHLNPAVTIAMAASGRMKVKKVPLYLVSQFIGAFLAGLVLYGLFAGSIAEFESENLIVRGMPESVQTAKMFGEFFNGIPLWLAMTAEGFGTFLLVLIIFSLTEDCNAGRPDDATTPLFIGLGVTSVICLIAPLTQAGLNPARDFGPRLVSWMSGWGKAAFPEDAGGFFWVYILAPILGGIAAAVFFTRLIEPAMRKKSETCDCCK